MTVNISFSNWRKSEYGTDNETQGYLSFDSNSNKGRLINLIDLSSKILLFPLAPLKMALWGVAFTISSIALASLYILCAVTLAIRKNDGKDLEFFKLKENVNFNSSTTLGLNDLDKLVFDRFFFLQFFVFASFYSLNESVRAVLNTGFKAGSIAALCLGLLCPAIGQKVRKINIPQIFDVNEISALFLNRCCFNMIPLEDEEIFRLEKGLSGLGFSPSDRPFIKDIEQHYKKKSLQCHPDKTKDPVKIARFKDISSCKDLLSDPKVLKRYFAHQSRGRLTSKSNVSAIHAVFAREVLFRLAPKSMLLQ